MAQDDFAGRIRLKRWRFGSSAEILDATTQAVLFDAIVADTAIEDRAAQDEAKPPPAALAAKRQAVRQALPTNLPRIDRHREIAATHCECGQALERIGEEVGEQDQTGLWVGVYRTTNFVAVNGKGRAVLYDFSVSRGGDNARRLLQGFDGILVSDDFSGYHALQSQGVTAALYMAHARRKLYEAHQFTGSPIAGQAVVLSLIESAKLNGHDPWADLKDVFERLPTLKHRDLAQLLPHNWRLPRNAVVADSPPFAAAA